MTINEVKPCSDAAYEEAVQRAKNFLCGYQLCLDMLELRRYERKRANSFREVCDCEDVLMGNEAFWRARMLEVGALIQLNADSIMGKCGLGIKWTCGRLLRKGMAQFVASDAHDPKERPPLLKDCYDHVCKRYGRDYADAIFRENALALLSGKWR
jgi:hypothetical protein